jgi:hypothetical protein
MPVTLLACEKSVLGSTPLMLYCTGSTIICRSMEVSFVCLVMMDVGRRHTWPDQV